MVATAAALVVVAAAVAAWVVINRTVEGGPLETSPDVTQAGVQAPVGKRAMFGYTAVRNIGSQPAELVSAELRPPLGDDGIALVVETRVGSPNSAGAGLWPNEFTHPENTQPLAGYRVKPGSVRNLIFVVDVRKPGESLWKTVTLTYKANGRTYRLEAKNAFYVCTPIDKTINGCLKAHREQVAEKEAK